MKSLADLQAIREKMQRQMDLRDADGDQIRVVVGVPGQEKVTYVNMSPDKVPAVVSEHLVNGRVVTDYTIGAAE